MQAGEEAKNAKVAADLVQPNRKASEMPLTPKGKVSIITGSARGIRRVIAEHHIEDGAWVVIADLAIEDAQKPRR